MPITLPSTLPVVVGGSRYSWISPAVVIRPILPTSDSTNHMLPSGAVTIRSRPALLVGTGKTLTAACAGVVPLRTRSGPTSNVSAVSRARRARAIGRVTSVRGGAIPPWSRVPPSRPPHQPGRRRTRDHRMKPLPQRSDGPDVCRGALVRRTTLPNRRVRSVRRSSGLLGGLLRRRRLRRGLLGGRLFAAAFLAGAF